MVSGQTSAVTDIRLATPDDRDPLVATVVAAFDQDPAFRAFFGSGPEFGELATRFVGSLLDRRLATGSRHGLRRLLVLRTEARSAGYPGCHSPSRPRRSSKLEWRVKSDAW